MFKKVNGLKLWKLIWSYKKIIFTRKNSLEQKLKTKFFAVI